MMQLLFWLDKIEVGSLLGEVVGTVKSGHELCLVSLFEKFQLDDDEECD